MAKSSPTLIATNSLSAHPHLDFLIILNPNSGPGTAPWWPNADYQREIPRLNALPNVTTLGYVRATYCQRAHGDICSDICTYAERGRADAGLKVQGVFVDETVNLYSKEMKRYLDGIDQRVKREDAFGGEGLVRLFFIFAFACLLCSFFFFA